jgi:PHD/YefM family antitoxin component YafN of YafNO toxin-antitoxin module
MGEVLERASVLKERVVLMRGGKRVAVVVPVEDLALLEALEDRLDLEDAKRAEAEARRKGEKPIPWERVRKGLRL